MAAEQETDERRRLERAREIALFRYSLIQEVISPHLTGIPEPLNATARRRREPLAVAGITGPGRRLARPPDGGSAAG